MLSLLHFCTALLCMKFSTFQKSNLVLQAVNEIESYLGYSQMFIFIKQVMEKSEMQIIIILSALRMGEAFCKVCWHKQSIHARKHSFSCCVWKLRQLLEELLRLSINVCEAILFSGNTLKLKQLCNTSGKVPENPQKNLRTVSASML